MSYQIILSKSVRKQIDALPIAIQERILNVLRLLVDDPYPQSSKKLQARKGRRFRISEYRIIYDVNDDESTIILLKIGHRGDLYR